MKMSKKELALNVLRILLGLFFIATAVMKLISLDNFEIYIFTFKIFSFNLAAWLARAVIAAEFVLGSCLIAKIFYRQTWWLTLLMLIGFTGLLIYTVLFRHDANCHCFGELIELNPAWSIVKNILTICLLCLVKNQNVSHFKAKNYVLILVLSVALIVPFILLTPDAIYRKIYTDNGASLNEKVWNIALQDSSLYYTLYNVQRIEYETNDTVIFQTEDRETDFLKGKKVVAVLSSGCEYCKASSQKMHTIFERNKLNEKDLHILIWGSAPSIARFITETHTDKASFRVISPYLAIDLVAGVFPTFFLLDNGKVVDVWDYRALNENEIVDFLQ